MNFIHLDPNQADSLVVDPANPGEICVEADEEKKKEKKSHSFISDFNETAFVHICRNLLNRNATMHNLNYMDGKRKKTS